MVNFVIYETNENLIDLYRKVIKKFLLGTRNKYRVHVFDRHDVRAEETLLAMHGEKIFIMNLDCPELNCLDIAKNIRCNDDFESQIILLTKRERDKVLDDLHSILYLDLIHIDYHTDVYLTRAIKEAYEIVSRYAAFTFTVYDEMFRLPFHEIYFITKNAHEDSVTIFTKDDSFIDYMTIKKAEILLSKDPRFMKTHRSCILNLYNVSSYDKKNNRVVFKNGMSTTLVSRHWRPVLEERLEDFDEE